MIFEFENLLNDTEINKLIEIISNVKEYSKFTDNGLFENKFHHHFYYFSF